MHTDLPFLFQARHPGRRRREALLASGDLLAAHRLRCPFDHISNCRACEATAAHVTTAHDVQHVRLIGAGTYMYDCGRQTMDRNAARCAKQSDPHRDLRITGTSCDLPTARHTALRGARHVRIPSAKVDRAYVTISCARTVRGSLRLRRAAVRRRCNRGVRSRGSNTSRPDVRVTAMSLAGYPDIGLARTPPMNPDRVHAAGAPEPISPR